MDPISSLDLLRPDAPSMKERVGNNSNLETPDPLPPFVKEGERQRRRTYAAVVTGN